MIYAAFTFWVILILFTGIGVYRLWTKLAKASWVNWALLPGTVISEMGYIFGCLITGGEIRRAKLMPSQSSHSSNRDGEPTAEVSAGLKHVGPILAAMVSIVACGTAIVIAHTLLGEPVIERFILGKSILPSIHLPKELPTSWESLWQIVSQQVALLKRMCETWGSVRWLNWRVPLFVYLSLCLGIRLFPVRRPIRPTLGAVITLAGVIALIGLLSKRFTGLMEDLWPLLTYIWASLLLLLVLTLVLLGLVRLIRILLGRDSA